MLLHLVEALVEASRVGSKIHERSAMLMSKIEKALSEKLWMSSRLPELPGGGLFGTASTSYSNS
jgi:hypothetical protein